MRRILERMGHTVRSQREAGVTLEPEENGTTFAENARIKARAICEAAGTATIADDSGLCVDALGGAPGVFSARYGGEGLDDVDRYELVLSGLRGQLDRRAKFVSAICCAFPNGDVLTARGECPGSIAYAPQGDNGFGYDPVFFVPELRKTYAQMTAEEKNQVSHRGKALAKFKMELEGYLNGAHQ